MNQALCLKILARIMEWDDDRAHEEYKWLSLMARTKYDGYRDFQAGMRFFESLVTWLQQFEFSDRETAYDFVREKLVYIGPSEMMKLVEQFYPKIIHNRLVNYAANRHDIPTYRVLVNPDACASIERLRRQTLIMGLSDGARIDGIRRYNAGRLSNEQLVLMTQLDKNKWEDLLQNLRADLNDPSACFRLVYLVDDFTGTGTSFFRFNEKKRKWSGKLWKFRDSIKHASDELGSSPFSSDWELCVHHYIATSSAKQGIEKCLADAKTALDSNDWSKNIHISFGTVLPPTFPLNEQDDKKFIELTNNYYNSVLQTEHTDVGGISHMGLGYGGCALPLVLEHNTPNNSVALLWAETSRIDRDGKPAHAMRPLFRRRQRHQ